MSKINKRLFGAEMPIEVQKILNERQNSPQAEDGTLTAQTYQYNLNERTPFVRMWTSVKIIDPAEAVEVLDAKKYGIQTAIIFDPNSTEKQLKDAYKIAETYRDAFNNKKLKTGDAPAIIAEIKNYNGGASAYVLTRQDERDQVDYARSLYTIGNHSYQSNYGEVTTMDNITESNFVIPSDQSGNVYRYGDNKNAVNLMQLFPQELAENKLRKPQSGITKVNSETDGSLGVVKKTIVDFVVNNFEDYDKIYNKYFLKPGATIWVDFGFSPGVDNNGVYKENLGVDDLYDPIEMLDSNLGVEKYLYDKNDGFVNKYSGNVEVIQGIVTDYNSKVNQDGTVNCSVTLTSTNSALMSFKTGNDVASRIKSILSRGVLYLGIQKLLQSAKDLGVKNTDDLRQFMNTPNHNSDADDIENYNRNLRILAAKYLSGTFAPGDNAVSTGIFIENFDLENVYISWGLFEDLIINSQFGFGKNENDILSGVNAEVRLDSSEAFTGFHKESYVRQRTLFSVPEEAPLLVYPKWWGKFYASNTDLPQSYTWQQKKYPGYDAEIDELTELCYDYSDGRDGVPYKYDKICNGGEDKAGRIPIREVFINTQVIIEAFEQEINVRKVLENIIDRLNNDASGLFNWKLVKGANDNELQVVDTNYDRNTETRGIVVNGTQLPPGTYPTKIIDPRFTFNIMSPDSIVKDYNIEFKLPQGNIGNMYAIKAMSYGNSIFSVDSDVEDTIDLINLDSDDLSIIYEPDLGTYRLEQANDRRQVNGHVYNVFNAVDRLLKGDVYSTKTTAAGISADVISGDDKDKMFKDTAVKDSIAKNVKEVSLQDLIEQNDENMEAIGFKVANTFTEYFDLKMKNRITEFQSNLLPFNLTLTTYGISNIQPGDVFNVNYLPEMYKKHTYCQVTKVIQDVGSDGWYTTLETAFRLNTYEKPDLTGVPDGVGDRIRLSAANILSLGLEDQLQVDDNTFYYWPDSNVGMQMLASHMTDITVRQNTGEIDLILDFRFTEKFRDVLKGDSVPIQNHEGNFISAFKDSISRENLETKFNYMAKGVTYDVADNPSEYKYGVGITPPDLNVKPGKRYQLWVHRGGVAIVDPNYTYYNNILKFFGTYVGDNGLYIRTEQQKEDAEVLNMILDAWEPGMMCFMPNQLISMADETLKEIKDIVVGDLVKAWDKQNNIIKKTIVTNTFTKVHNNVRELYLDNGKMLKPTGNHPFLTKDNNWVSVDNLQIGDYVKDIKDGWIKVKNIISVDGDYLTYDFENEYETIIADGIITHLA